MGNRLAWQVALKLSDAQRKEDHRPEESSNFGYSMMRGESIEILENGPTVARLKIDGSLVTPDGIDVATFEEILTIPREGRIIDVDLTLQPKSLPTDGPWDNYYGLRFAWNDMMAEVRPACHGKSWETDRDYLQAPEWVEIKSEENLGVTILSGGIPFFRRYGQRRMDAVLIPDGESGRRFHFGIGIDLADPLKEATRFLSPEPFILSEVPPLSKSVYRFLDVTGASISIIHLEPVYEEDSIPTTPNEGMVGGTTGDVERGSDREGVDNGGTDDDGSLPPLAGFRVVLQETSGKRGKAEIKSYWSIESVTETDLLSQKKGRALDLTDPHSLSVTLDASQILPLEFRLSKDVGE